MLLGGIISPLSDVRDCTATSTSAFRFSSVAFSGHYSFRSSLLLINSSSCSCGATGMEVAEAEAASMPRETGSTTLSSSSSWS